MLTQCLFVKVIQKLVSQEDTCTNLKQLTKENDKKLEKLAGEKQTLKQEVEDLKYAGPVVRTGAGRKLVDGYEVSAVVLLALSTFSFVTIAVFGEVLRKT